MSKFPFFILFFTVLQADIVNQGRAYEYFLKGEYLLLNKNYSQAEIEYSKALSLAPNSPTILQSLVELKSYQGEYADAIKYLEIIIDLSETDFKSNYQIFLSEYYSKERYAKILKNIYDVTLSNLDGVDHKTKEKVQEYFLIKDRLNLFKKNLSFFDKLDEQEQSINHTIRTQYNNLSSDLQTVFDEYKYLWQYL